MTQLLFASLLLLLVPATTGKAPLIMIPGLAGSVMKAKLDNGPAPHFWCEKNSDWYVTSHPV